MVAIPSRSRTPGERLRREPAARGTGVGGRSRPELLGRADDRVPPAGRHRAARRRRAGPRRAHPPQRATAAGDRAVRGHQPARLADLLVAPLGLGGPGAGGTAPWVGQTTGPPGASWRPRALWAGAGLLLTVRLIWWLPDRSRPTVGCSCCWSTPTRSRDAAGRGCCDTAAHRPSPDPAAVLLAAGLTMSAAVRPALAARSPCTR